MKKIGILMLFVIALTVFLFFRSDIFLPGNQKETVDQDTGYQVDEPGIYDSADTAVIVEISTSDQTIALRNMDIEKQYTLSYDGTTYFYDKYGSSLAADQMAVGDIVDLTFYEPTKRCNTMQISNQSFTYDTWSNYQINTATSQITIGKVVYNCTPDTIVVSNGEEKDLTDLNEMDILSFKGIGTDIYSIVVEKGHGYLRLKNDEYFYDGWIEVGTKIIQKITENMVIVVPEGSQQVVVSNQGTSGSKSISVERDQEVTLDIGDLKGADPEYGNVVFTITPSDASLYIDGEKMDYSTPVKLEYGIHQMIVRQDGYDTITQYLKVGQASAGIEVNMTKSDDSSSTVSGNDSAQSQSSDTIDSSTASEVQADTTSTQDYYVEITSPSDTEVYLDDNYVGISPCNFKKEAGAHTITLRKTDYESKTYTIQLDDENESVTYSFPELTEA